MIKKIIILLSVFFGSLFGMDSELVKTRLQRQYNKYCEYGNIKGIKVISDDLIRLRIADKEEIDGMLKALASSASSHKSGQPNLKEQLEQKIRKMHESYRSTINQALLVQKQLELKERLLKQKKEQLDPNQFSSVDQCSAYWKEIGSNEWSVTVQASEQRCYVNNIIKQTADEAWNISQNILNGVIDSLIGNDRELEDDFDAVRANIESLANYWLDLHKKFEAEARGHYNNLQIQQDAIEKEIDVIVSKYGLSFSTQTDEEKSRNIIAQEDDEYEKALRIDRERETKKREMQRKHRAASIIQKAIRTYNACEECEKLLSKQSQYKVWLNAEFNATLPLDKAIVDLACAKDPQTAYDDLCPNDIKSLQLFSRQGFKVAKALKKHQHTFITDESKKEAYISAIVKLLEGDSELAQLRANRIAKLFMQHEPDAEEEKSRNVIADKVEEPLLVEKEKEPVEDDVDTEVQGQNKKSKSVTNSELDKKIATLWQQYRSAYESGNEQQQINAYNAIEELIGFDKTEDIVAAIVSVVDANTYVRNDYLNAIADNDHEKLEKLRDGLMSRNIASGQEIDDAIVQAKQLALENVPEQGDNEVQQNGNGADLQEVQPLPGGGNNVPVIQRKSWWQRWRPAVKLTAICTVIGTAGYFAYKWLKR